MPTQDGTLEYSFNTLQDTLEAGSQSRSATSPRPGPVRHLPRRKCEPSRIAPVVPNFCPLNVCPAFTLYMSEAEDCLGSSVLID